ncbi:ABC transporter permease [Actinomadura sp. 7K507]|uniref:ABC transporter permease n=1 Tax=Actinomadura sp. 7K507 TaxID=2530365 RepID=UPI001045BD7D|nr:ABC transporter permease [Actinomadura sp. 7K507]TDC88731.1 ABC transporter permease [Actinomadura sp. 7K507]
MAARPAPAPVTEAVTEAVDVRRRRGVAGVAAKAAVYAYPVVLVVVAWEVVAGSGLFTPFTLPSPERVWDRARTAWEEGTLLEASRITLGRVLASFGLALAAGVPLGLLMGRVRTVRLMFRPVVSFLFPTPKVAVYPALVILFGLGTASKVAMGFAEAVFPVLLATTAASSRVEPSMVWSARGLGTSRAGVLVRVVLPAALPGILTGARIGLVGAISGVFVAELIVAADGLGHDMAVAYRTLATADMYVAVVMICAIGFVLDRLFLLARARLLAWTEEGPR